MAASKSCAYGWDRPCQAMVTVWSMTKGSMPDSAQQD
jgi:hypothetical protein